MTSVTMVLNMDNDIETMLSIETMLAIVIILTVIIGVCLRQYGIRQGW